jgi:hypothetical protein
MVQTQMSDEVKLEEQWVREKHAKQEAARRPPPKPPRMLLGVVIAVLLMASAGAAIYFVARSPEKPEAPASQTVRIEVRSMPAMDIAKDGRHIGRTPLSFLVSKSKDPITLQADWVEQRVYQAGRRQVPRTATKTVVPDHDQTIDFTRKDR